MRLERVLFLWVMMEIEIQEIWRNALRQLLCGLMLVCCGEMHYFAASLATQTHLHNFSVSSEPPFCRGGWLFLII